MAGRFFYVDVHFFHKNTYAVLVDELGPWGPLTWLALLAQGKNHRPAGQFTWTGEADAFRQLFGHDIDPADVPFTFAEFLKVTGRLKHTRVAKTSRTRRGHVANVALTRWEQWQKESRKWSERERMSRKRGQVEANTEQTPSEHDATPKRTHPSSRTRTRTTPKPPLNGSQEHVCGRCPTPRSFPTADELQGHLEDVHGVVEARRPAAQETPA